MAGPFDGLAAKLNNRQDAVLQCVGDSTCAGMFGYVDNPLHGWVGQLATRIGAELDVNVHYHGAAYPGSTVWPGWNQDEMLNTASRGDRPTLTVWNGAIGGSQATNLVSWINGQNLIPDPNPDAVLVACGFNDVIHGANLLTRTQSLTAAIRGRCPDAPIVITTENRSTGTYPTSYFAASFNAMTNYYVGHPLNLDPPLQASGVEANVWVLDTQQAYTAIPLTDWMTLDDTVGGLHPNSTGYQAQADWMYERFPPAGRFNPTDEAKPKWRSLGGYYPATPKIKDGGFRPLIARN